MKYRVEGADKKTGEERVIEVEAGDARGAEVIASNKGGILVSSVKPDESLNELVSAVSEAQKGGKGLTPEAEAWLVAGSSDRAGGAPGSTDRISATLNRIALTVKDISWWIKFWSVLALLLIIIQILTGLILWLRVESQR